jgi:predicted homoserine dehydrogenase-like protein
MIGRDAQVLDTAAGVSPVEKSPVRPGTDVVRVGVIGYGYWGPNIVRNLHGIEHCQVVSICDKNPAALKRAARSIPPST